MPTRAMINGRSKEQNRGEGLSRYCLSPEQAKVWAPGEEVVFRIKQPKQAAQRKSLCAKVLPPRTGAAAPRCPTFAPESTKYC